MSSALAQMTLTWPQKTEAREYLGEIAEDKDFISPIMVFKTDKNFYELSKIDLPKFFYFRVRYLDQWQRLSHFSNTAKVTFNQTEIQTPNNEPSQNLPSTRPGDFYFFGLIPSLIDSQIDSEKVSHSSLFALKVGRQKRYHDLNHRFEFFYVPFKDNIEGSLTSLDYNFFQRFDHFFWGPSAELMNFNVLYKEKAKISGTVLNLGAQVGSDHVANLTCWWRVDLQGSHDLKGFQIKGELSRPVIETPQYSISTGLAYRYFTYQNGQFYRFSSLGLHLTLEK